MQPSLWPSIWSAVAASCSAVAALQVMLIQKRNLRESNRPDLVLMGWERTPHGAERDVVSFKLIKNIGKGTAFQVIGGQESPPGQTKPGATLPIFMQSIWITHIASGEETSPHATEAGQFKINWEQLASSPIRVKLRLLYQDTFGNYYRTTYELEVFQLKPAMFHSSRFITTGVKIYTFNGRRTKFIPQWWIAASSWGREGKNRLATLWKWWQQFVDQPNQY